MPTIYTHINANKRRSWILILLSLAILITIGYFLDQYYSDGGYFFIVIAILYATVSALVGYYTGDKIALRMSGAIPLTKEANPYVVRMVENLAITAGLPTPKVYIIPDPDINAFATGRDPAHASIAVTEGAIQKLENEELEAVIAHELSHIGNYDVRYMTLIIVIVGTIVILSDLFWRFGRIRGGKNNPLLVIGLALVILGAIFAPLIKFAVSRRREYLADASGALLTRYPEGLAKALEKIRDHGSIIERANKSTAHLYIANPLSKGVFNLFSTHPPIEDRINRLRQMGNVTQ
ncbi:MAG: M48 family metallopeptidase [Patescibacteria group bacterium]|jgi:heat shock protein HtpX